MAAQYQNGITNIAIALLWYFIVIVRMTSKTSNYYPYTQDNTKVTAYFNTGHLTQIAWMNRTNPALELVTEMVNESKGE